MPTQGHYSSRLPTPEDQERAVWGNARHRYSVGSGASLPAAPATVVEGADPATGLRYLSGPGLHIVALDEPTTEERLIQSVRLVLALCHGSGGHHVGALAIRDGVDLSLRLLQQLADRNIIVPTVEADSAWAKAQAFMTEFMQRHEKGLENLDRLAASTRAHRG